LRVVLNAGEGAMQRLGARGRARAIEHLRELFGTPATRLVRERDEQLPDLLAPALARHRLELPRVNAKGERDILAPGIANVRHRGLDAIPHLVAVNEQELGVRERR